jgi:NitT/TauT family transport system substrate-binding protein
MLVVPTMLVLVQALSGCGGPATTPTSTPAQADLTKVTIALGFIPNVQFAPYYVALNRGYYRQEGLDVTFRHGVIPDLIKLLGAGDEGVNFAAASGDEVIPARLQGIPVVYVMTWYRQYPVAAASIVGKGPTLTKPADLRGRKVGVPGPFGATYVGLQALLRSAGLGLNDVRLETIGFTQVESLSQGQVEVAMVYIANEPVQLRSKGFEVSTLPVSDYVRLASNGLVTNEKTLRDNPDLVGKVVRATLRGIKDTLDNPVSAFEEALKQVPEAGGDNTDLQLQVLKESVKLMQPQPGKSDPALKHPLGWTDPEVWVATQDFLYEAGIITKKGDVNTMFTNRFVEQAGITWGKQEQEDMTKRPADFSFRYTWSAGSMPPPYHYEYTIEIGPGTEGKITFLAGYAGMDAPQWVETFRVEDEDADRLYALVAEKKLMEKKWRTQEAPPVGGSSYWAQITSNGRQADIPSHLESGDEAVVADVYEDMRALVPKSVWDDLMDRYNRYQKEFKSGSSR